MDMNDLYLVLLRLHGWEFMAEASHINAKKAVRGFASDLQDFHEQGQRSSAAQLMQHGASAVAVAAVEDALQPCVANDQSQLMGMFGKFFDKLEARDDKLGKFFDKLDARDVKQDTRNTVLYDTMGTLVVAIKENHDVTQQNFHIMDEKLADANAIMAENKAETDAQIADNKAETDAKMAEIVASADAKIADNKAETDAKIAEIVASADAKMAEIVNALSKVATGSATDCVPDAPAEIMNALSKVASGSATGSVPDAPAKLPMRKYKKYTTESKKITLQWVMKNISYPYADIDELEMLQKKTGVDTIDRMRQLIKQLRTKEMVQDKHGKWCRRTTTKPSVVGNKRSWTQKNINDMM
jgi:hypothetical protein